MNDFTVQKSIDELLMNSTPTSYKSIYKISNRELIKGLPLVIIFFGASTVGKDTLSDILGKLPFVRFVKTGTSRQKRSNEDANRYTWFRSQKPSETKEQYIEAVKKENALIEWSYHDDALYGLPEQNIRSSLAHKVSVIRGHYNSVEPVRKAFEHIANVIGISVHPYSWLETKSRILKIRDNPQDRVTDSMESIMQTNKIADFVIFNSFENGALLKTQEQLIDFVEDLKNKVS